jgi:DNA-binding transcriptional LysR family regulator
MCAAAQRYPAMRVAITRGPTELQVQQLRSRQLDAMVVDMRRVAPATDLNIESLGEIRTGFVVNASHPLATKQTVTFEDIGKYPVASTPLSDEVVRLLVDQYGPLANPSAMVTLACEDVAGLLATVAQSQAIYLGVLAAAKTGLQMGSLVELPLKTKLKVNARFAYVTLAGRTEAPVMGWFRQFVQQHLVD